MRLWGKKISNQKLEWGSECLTVWHSSKNGQEREEKVRRDYKQLPCCLLVFSPVCTLVVCISEIFSKWLCALKCVCLVLFKSSVQVGSGSHHHLLLLLSHFCSTAGLQYDFLVNFSSKPWAGVFVWNFYMWSECPLPAQCSSAVSGYCPYRCQYVEVSMNAPHMYHFLLDHSATYYIKCATRYMLWGSMYKLLGVLT